jgi:S-DNA-T family DNA segregation ATPase FtsK/SpoIIIE
MPPNSSYPEFEKLMPKIESWIKCYADSEWLRFKGCIELKIANKDIDNSEPYVPIETKNTELYFGQTWFREQIKIDMLDMPHVMIIGATNSGKTRCFFIVLVTLVHNHDHIEIYAIQVSDKKDLEHFAHVKQMKYFARNIQTADQLIKHLLTVKEERNKLLTKYHLNNFTEYNKKFPDNIMKPIYIACDEFEKLMPPENDDIDPEGYKIKKRIIYNFRKLTEESRSAGIYFILCEQRPDRVNMDPNIKQNLNTIVAFRSNNLATAKTMTDDARTYRLDNRTALVLADYDKFIKTPFIDNAVMYKYIKDKIERNHQYINIKPQDNLSTTPNTPTVYTDKSTDKVIDMPKQRNNSKGAVPKNVDAKGQKHN